MQGFHLWRPRQHSSPDQVSVATDNQCKVNRGIAHCGSDLSDPYCIHRNFWRSSSRSDTSICGAKTGTVFLEVYWDSARCATWGVPSTGNCGPIFCGLCHEIEIKYLTEVYRYSSRQCRGSGFVGRNCVSWIRILLSSSKIKKKNPWYLLFCDFFMTFCLWNMM
jgi:hypothetical protein